MHPSGAGERRDSLRTLSRHAAGHARQCQGRRSYPGIPNDPNWSADPLCYKSRGDDVRDISVLSPGS